MSIVAGIILCSCSLRTKKASLELSSADAFVQAAAAVVDNETMHRLAVAASVEKRLSGMSVEEKIAQLFIIGIEGDGPIVPPLPNDIPGAFLFFKYNIAQTPEEVIEFIQAIRAECPPESVPPFFAIDHEGGTVNRLRSLASPLPSAQLVAKKTTPEKALQLYRSAAAQLRALGFHLNIAPVAESQTAAAAEFLDTRSYGTVENSADFASAAVRGFQSESIISAVKHFPGNTGDDPHEKLPRLEVSAEEFDSVYLEPFRRVLNENPAALVLSHVLVPHFDADFPACLSERFVASLLRYELSYQGLIISDDLYMTAVEQSGFSPEKATIAAISAGVNMLMLSVKNFLPLQKVISAKMMEDEIFAAKVDDSVRRILHTKYEYGLLKLDDRQNLVIGPSDSATDCLNSFNTAYAEGWKIYERWFN